ncbi:MAG TPA: hypothetical protein ENN51_00575, partial [candidate division WOR-3 bacterium]|nr:hypothetical protein [candidate division WOR-3 bacterium]
MNPLLTLLLTFALLLLGLMTVLLVVFLRRGRAPAREGDDAMLLQRQFDALRDQTGRGLAEMSSRLDQRLGDLDRRMTDTVTGIGARLDSANTTVQNVQAALGELSQATRQVYEVGRDVRSLQDI